MSVSLRETPVLLHVGPHKTGTTFLQKRVFPRLEAFYVGIHLPPDLRGVFAVIRAGKEDYASKWQACARAASDRILKEAGGRPVVISWEKLFGELNSCYANNERIAGALRDLFPGAFVCVVLRRQDTWLESYYREILKWPSPPTIQDFLNWDGAGFRKPRIEALMKGEVTRIVDVSLFDWLPFLKTYARLFGREKLIVLPYELLQRRPEKFLERIAQPLHVGLPKNTAFRIENRGLSPFSARIAVWLGRRYNPKNECFWSVLPAYPLTKLLSPARRWHWQLERAFHKSRHLNIHWILANVVDRFASQGALLDETMRHEILDLYRGPNERLDREFKIGLQEFGYY